MKRFCLYTVLIGGYTQLNNPLPREMERQTEEPFERICFTDDLSIESHGWKLIKLDTHGLDSRRASRLPKLLPHRYLEDFEWSLYIDTTVRLKMSPLNILNEYIDQKLAFWSFRHPWRNCIYDEAEEVIRLGYDNEHLVREQMDHYKFLGYPKNAGLSANTFILRRHNDPSVIQLDEIWFEHVLRYSKRDQLSFNFVAHYLNFRHGFLAGELTDNQYMVWPGYPEQTRIPADFDEYLYEWLNPEVNQSGLPPKRHYFNIGRVKGLTYKKHRSELDRLANKYKTDKGSIYYNAHGYAAVYERYFKDIKDKNLRLLELGLLRHDVQARQPGGPYQDMPSIFMWREYFPKAEIIGFDIADFSTAPDIPKCKIVRGDIGNRSDLISLALSMPSGFDIIIDDASHASHHQQIALGVLFPFLQRGGYYIIEDLNYQPPSLEQPQTIKTKQILKGLLCGKLVQSAFMTERELAYLAENFDFIEFYDSLDRNFGDPNSDSLAIIKKR